MIGKTIDAAPVSEEISAFWRENILAALKSGQTVQQNILLHTPDKQRNYYNAHFIPEFDAETQELVSVMNVSRDISELMNAHLEMKEAQKTLRNVLDLVPHVICAKDYNGNYLLANQAMSGAYRLTPEELIQKNQKDLHDDPVELEVMLKQDRDVIDSRKELFIPEDTFTDTNGRTRILQTIKIPFSYFDTPAALIIGVDITDQRRAENEKNILNAQLRQRRKLESIGTLAGGIAHKINNPLTGIINYAQLLTEDDNAITRKFSGEILNEANRVAQIVEYLLSFARQDTEFTTQFHLEDVIYSSLTLFGATFKLDQITEIVDIEPGLPMLSGHPQQIQQVGMNLLTNARRALNLRYPGYHKDKKLFIKADIIQRDGHRYARIIIEDKGVGISEEDQKHIFEPFYTAKSHGETIGLGLSVTLSIIQEHEGFIECESEINQFTRFTVLLPVTED